MYLKLNHVYYCDDYIHLFKKKAKQTKMQHLLMKYIEKRNSGIQNGTLAPLKEAISLCHKEQNDVYWFLLINLYRETCDQQDPDDLHFLIDILMEIQK